MEQDTHTPQYSVECLTLLTQRSERSLFVSGGELKLSKCFWYLIQWLWESNNIPYMASSEECLGILSIMQGIDTDAPIRIQLLEPSEYHLTLGVHINQMGTLLLELLKQARKFSAAAAHKSLDRVDAYIMYKIFCTPSLHYPLPISNITSKALTYMQTNLLKTFKW
jgi:hypothetical protein